MSHVRENMISRTDSDGIGCICNYYKTQRLRCKINTNFKRGDVIYFKKIVITVEFWKFITVAFHLNSCACMSFLNLCDSL